MFSQQLASTMQTAVSDCIKSGERVGLLLSGGLDSAVIQAIANLHDLYCVTWPDQDNHTVAELAAQGKPVKRVTFSKEDMVSILPEVARLTDGQGTWSQCCQWFAAEQAAIDGCDVLMTGEGADELFGGYARYRILYWLDRMYQDRHLEEYAGIIKHMFGSKADIINRMFARTSSNTVAAVDGALVEAMADAEFGKPLHDLLGHETAMIEAHVKHARYPFMDDRVIKFARELPAGVRVTDAECKAVLRDAARLLGVPRAITDEKTKKGLFIPQSWRPEGEPKWSRRWFEELMADAAA